MTDEKARLVVHLGSGKTVTVYLESDAEPEELAEQLAAQICEQGRPHWLVLDSTLIFTGAVSAIEVL